MTELKLLQDYIESCERISAFETSTLDQHRRVGNNWCAFLAKHSTRSLSNANCEDFLAFIEHREREGVKAITIKADLFVLRTLYDFLFRHRKILSNPAASLPKMICEPPAEKAYLSIEECVRLLKSFDTSETLGLTNYLVIALLWSTGLRNRELRALTWADIDLVQATLLVRYAKGGKQRQLFLNDRLLNDLIAYKHRLGGHNHEPVFFSFKRGKKQGKRNPFSMAKLCKIVRESALNAGLSKPVTPMTFRHTFATHMFEAGATIEEIKELLGHEAYSESTIYIHVSLDAAKDLLNNHLANPLTA